MDLSTGVSNSYNAALVHKSDETCVEQNKARQGRKRKRSQERTDGPPEQDGGAVELFLPDALAVGVEELEEQLRDDVLEHLGDPGPVARTVAVRLGAHR
jgi:hypothetical protein